MLPGGGPVDLVVAAAVGAAVSLAVSAAVRSRASSPTGAAARLEEAHRRLLRHNRELLTFGEIASTMQTTMDVSEVIERVLVGLTEHLGFPRALAGTCDQAESVVTGWLAAAAPGAPLPDHLLSLDLHQGRGVLADALNRPGITVVSSADPTNEAERRLMAFFGGGKTSVIVVPMRCRNHLVGCLLVGTPPGEERPGELTEALLDRVATQAGLALANVRLCVERTQKLTLEQERIRIAADLHDSIAQALFGIVYQLKGCARFVPPGNTQLRESLEGLRTVAQSTLSQVRQVIFDVWAADPSASSLSSEISSLTRLTGDGPHLTARISPEFDAVDVETRRGIFRVAHEAVTNVVKHASAAEAWLSVTVDAAEVTLEVVDDGVGLSPDAPQSSYGFGLRGMEDRVAVLGGSLAVTPANGHGTRVVARIPRGNCRVP